MNQTPGEKLQKVLARAGLGSRRQMECWIEAGRVRVDGHPARLGDRVSPSARLSIDGRPLAMRATAAAERRVIVYHKPEGEVTTRSDPEGRPTVFRRLPRLARGRWIVVGRLDVNTAGLLLFTTDGKLANRLMHPRYELKREYAVRIFGRVSPAMIEAVTSGVELEDGVARFESVEALSATDSANDWYRVRLRQGRRREVRRLWESQGVTVSRLMRVQFGPVTLPPGLRQGQHRALDRRVVDGLARLVALPTESPGRRARAKRSSGGHGGRRRR